MKRFFCLIFILVPAIAFAKPDNEEQVLINHGIELCSMMKEKASCEAYLSVFLNFPESELLDSAKSIGESDYTNIESITRIKINENLFHEEFRISYDEENIPENLRKDIINNLFNGFPVLINSKFCGADQLALSSLLVTSVVFDVNFYFDKYIYVFNFKDAFPICVVYSHGKDNAVSASATIMFDKNFLNEMSEYIITENIDF